MTINVEAKLAAQCDECGSGFDERDLVFCSSCRQDLLDEIKAAEKDRDDFESELSKAQEEIEDLKIQVASLTK